MGHRDPFRAQLTKSSTFDTAYSTLLAVGTDPCEVRSSSTLSSLESCEILMCVDYEVSINLHRLIRRMYLYQFYIRYIYIYIYLFDKLLNIYSLYIMLERTTYRRGGRGDGSGHGTSGQGDSLHSIR